jgi:hypothetical protein
LSRIDPRRLDDLAEVLSEVRSWGGIEDRGRGTFYLRRKPYLHFHVGRDSRRADVRRSEGWVQFELPEPLGSDVKRVFLGLLREEYEDR